MKSEIKDFFTNLPGGDNEAMEAFIKILELPNDEFDQTYFFFKDNIEKIFHSTSYQQTNLERLKMMPPVDIEEEKREVELFLKKVDEDDELSENKREMIHIMFNSTLEVLEQLLISGRASIDVKVVKLNEDAVIPEYAYPTDAGADVCASEGVKIEPGETVIVKTGLAVAIPTGYEIQIRPRSGLSAKTSLRIANSPATIDSSYRGEIGVIITNIGDSQYFIDKGMKIAQMVINPVPMIKWNIVNTIEDLGETDRGSGGFGSTGVSIQKS